MHMHLNFSTGQSELAAFASSEEDARSTVKLCESFAPPRLETPAVKTGSSANDGQSAWGEKSTIEIQGEIEYI